MKNENAISLGRNMTLYNDSVKLLFPYRPNGTKEGATAVTKKAARQSSLPEILFITSYPPSECGIATYSQDLMRHISEKFGDTFSLKVCALEKEEHKHTYSDTVKYILEERDVAQYTALAQTLNGDGNLVAVYVQHEFGLYGGRYGDHLLRLLSKLEKPVITTLHTVLPRPDAYRKRVIQEIAFYSNSLVVMTAKSARILEIDYGIPKSKIAVIPHGVHLVSLCHLKNKNSKIHLADRIVLSTFGLMNSGKSIETALEALPAIIEKFPNVIYLIIGKTHPEVARREGEHYRDFLYDKVVALQLQNHVRFINRYLSLEDLLDYLQRTSIYLFTSKDPNQAVSGTLAYAMGSGCLVVSTPIPHSMELIEGAGMHFDFENSDELADVTLKLLSNPDLSNELRMNAMHKIAPTSWQNSAIAHVELLMESGNDKHVALRYNVPDISLQHIKKMTTDIGMIQFSIIAEPDGNSGYTLDDNARALIAMCQHYEQTSDESDLPYIFTYFNFIEHCQEADGYFLNYVDSAKNFTQQNREINLSDANGRAVWALGYLLSKEAILPKSLIDEAEEVLINVLPHIPNMHSTRAMAFTIKGLYYFNLNRKSIKISQYIKMLSNRLVQMYHHESELEWEWFESYLTYANSVLPEALLCAFLDTNEKEYQKIAKTTFDFLLSVLFQDGTIRVISNNGWQKKGEVSHLYGEQPIDVAYTIMALCRFYDVYQDPSYLEKMTVGFNWFLGKNHLRQIIYNPITGGCFDGLEEDHINLNQGAESSLSYVLSRLTVEQHLHQDQQSKMARNYEVAASY